MKHKYGGCNSDAYLDMNEMITIIASSTKDNYEVK